MEEDLEAVILGDGNHNAIEYIILHNVLGMPQDNAIDEPYIFTLDDMTPDQIKTNFRFNREDIGRLVEILGLPNEIRTETHNVVSGVTGLCILLRRLAYPNRLSDIQKMFGLSPQSLSQIINHMTTLIINNWGHLLDNLQDLQWLNRGKMEYYAEAIHTKGAPIPNCWGFIDGTARPICRPSVDQETYYSGHKRQHCVKYQSILTPDGIIVNLKGAYAGRRHDAGIFRESAVYQQFQRNAVFPDNQNFVIYGDQAYGIMELLLCPYPGRQLLPHQLEFNQAMKILRVAVEWGFQKVVSNFAFLDFKKNQKLMLQDLEAMFKVGVLFTNCHTCLYGSQTSQYFNIRPPTLEEYFGV